MPVASDADLHLLFLDARTHRSWLPKPIDDATLHRLYELTRMPPTSSNIQPLRVVFVRSPEAKAKLKPTLAEFNVEKTMPAGATAIIAHDLAFFEKMSALVPTRPDLQKSLASLPAEQQERLALQSATLQAGYLILAARALGLDAGPMGGFDADQVNAAFFPGTRWRTSLLINLGYGDGSKMPPRAPRLEFNDACRID